MASNMLAGLAALSYVLGAALLFVAAPAGVHGAIQGAGTCLGLGVALTVAVMATKRS